MLTLLTYTSITASMVVPTAWATQSGEAPFQYFTQTVRRVRSNTNGKPTGTSQSLLTSQVWCRVFRLPRSWVHTRMRAGYNPDTTHPRCRGGNPIKWDDLTKIGHAHASFFRRHHGSSRVYWHPRSPSSRRVRTSPTPQQKTSESPIFHWAAQSIEEVTTCMPTLINTYINIGIHWPHYYYMLWVLVSCNESIPFGP